MRALGQSTLSHAQLVLQQHGHTGQRPLVGGVVGSKREHGHDGGVHVGALQGGGKWQSVSIVCTKDCGT